MILEPNTSSLNVKKVPWLQSAGPMNDAAGFDELLSRQPVPCRFQFHPVAAGIRVEYFLVIHPVTFRKGDELFAEPIVPHPFQVHHQDSRVEASESKVGS